MPIHRSIYRITPLEASTVQSITNDIELDDLWVDIEGDAAVNTPNEESPPPVITATTNQWIILLQNIFKSPFVYLDIMITFLPGKIAKWLDFPKLNANYKLNELLTTCIFDKTEYNALVKFNASWRWKWIYTDIATDVLSHIGIFSFVLALIYSMIIYYVDQDRFDEVKYIKVHTMTNLYIIVYLLFMITLLTIILTF
ncbi:putative membrane protein [Wickerhamomyces ciferrii]|uniref:Membrane protein n=1 Tax=Wickerhamomyces ciferrii (strain ATCC 14091 / BCRC 22168 / CBS 111 / JCM 3599 / NBRC 0793 / NRRL Y-1031 F-60-10) TaxID=1206466 RepID=K0KYD7_WICCF|nr:uncharacterized protein BN7_5696 [Wickerhamomyces ciferrii]CCH46108.1 putative membrane protein [Wickerhamomyces ciferrii]